MITRHTHRATAYDPFGEPIDAARIRADAADSGAGVGSYSETRRAALAFWVLALLFVAGRIYLSDPTGVRGPVAEAAPAAAQMTALR